MELWNTLTRRVEGFSAGPQVSLYVCGITPYATTHLGHARTYLVFDVLVRELERRGHAVRYVQNVTDVDDPLFARAKELGRTTADVAAEFTRIFQEDMRALSVRPPDAFPHASREVPRMQSIIAGLLRRGYAYVRDDRVYYSVRSFPSYGRLSGLDRDRMIAVAQARGEDPADPRKEDPLDFVLWKPSLPGEDSWESPWGRGRPGWHVECSTMALEYLGPTLDIHGGGSDLIYPHHENEIAQSEACTGKTPFARFWVHVEMVRLGGVKMSKSLGNMVMVRDVLWRYGPAAVRHYLLDTHYRAPLDYAEEGLRRSAERVRRLGQALRQPGRAVDAEALSGLQARFDSALAEDLDTPAALAALDDLAGLILTAPEIAGAPELAPALNALVARLGLAGAPLGPSRPGSLQPERR